MFDIAISEIEGVPRVRDIDLAEVLGFERPRVIRQLISRNVEALNEFGEVRRMVRRTSGRGGAPADEYWLNEKQALFICTKSEARLAVEITIQMVEVFAGWRAGLLTSAGHAGHGPLVPRVPLPQDAAEWLALVREMRLTHGKAAARQIWAQSPLPAPDPDSGGEFASLRQFLDECCHITGNKGDFVRSSKIRAAFFRWNGAAYGGESGPRAWSNAFRRLASLYNDPLTGARFWPVKRSNTGYVGLRLA